MNAFMSIIRITVRQMTGLKRAVGFGALSLVPALFLILGPNASAPDELDNYLGSVLVALFFALVLPIITLVVSVSALGDERKDKTLSFLVLRPISRLQIVMAKTGAAWAVSSAFGVFGALGLTAVYMVMGGESNVLPAMVLGTLIACAAYSAPLVLLGYAVARPTLVGLAFMLIIDNSFATQLPRLAPISPWRNGLAATLGAFPEGFGVLAIQGAIGDLMPGVGDTVLRAAVIVVIALGICSYLLERSDNI